ncbi:hypothetical protein OG21DRAFT_59878 [Imleria badia]|nr:hypothetical protein OG21DRAFT_59878 [Imleria badia]
MSCAFSSMSNTQTLLCTILVIWAALSFPFVNGSFIMSNAGNCSSNEFWYEPIRNCVPFGKPSFGSVPPDGIACPLEGSWYWSSQLSACLPASPDVATLGSVSCPSDYTWDPTTSTCIQVEHTRRSATCGTTEFWFPEKATCLARRGFKLPSTTRCPSGWYWNTELMSCAPANPEALSSLTCRSGFVWSPSTLICQRAPSPSRRTPSSAPSRRSSPPSPSPGQPSRRHSLKSRNVSLCPTGLDACPILRAGDMSDYECVDPKYDLQHCGGCSVDGRGEDCTSIKGVWNVECIRVRCFVLTCTGGYVPSIDQRTCVKL